MPVKERDRAFDVAHEKDANRCRKLLFADNDAHDMHDRAASVSNIFGEKTARSVGGDLRTSSPMRALI